MAKSSYGWLPLQLHHKIEYFFKFIFYILYYLKNPGQNGKRLMSTQDPPLYHPLGTLFWPASVGWLLDRRNPSTKDLTRLVWPDTIHYLLVLFKLKSIEELEWKRIPRNFWWKFDGKFMTIFMDFSWDFRWIVQTWFVIHVCRWMFQKFPIGAMKMWKLVHVVYWELWLPFLGRRKDAL